MDKKILIQIKDVGSHFGLTVQKIRRPSNAILSKLYVVNEAFILRGRPLGKDTVRNFQKEIKLLEQVSLRVPYALPQPIDTLDHQHFLLTQKYLWTVYTLIPGRILGNWFDIHRRSSSDIRFLIQELQRLQSCTKGIFPTEQINPLLFVREIQTKLRSSGALLMPKVRARVKLALERVSQFAQGLSRQEFCFVHGDFHFGNIILHPTQRKIVGLIDLDFCGIGTPLEDLAYIVMMLSRDYTLQKPVVDVNKIKQLLRWYRIQSSLIPTFYDYLLLYAFFDIAVFSTVDLPKKKFYLKYQIHLLQLLCKTY